MGYDRTRHYFLRDLQQEPPRWVAHFQVHAAKNKVLADFRLESLSVENVRYASALGNPGERVIYEYAILRTVFFINLHSTQHITAPFLFWNVILRYYLDFHTTCHPRTYRSLKPGVIPTNLQFAISLFEVCECVCRQLHLE
ncbi:hypothetical protein F4781DRAFT_159584 [Annulohypoxylon bovei var. microspora]|nr:hypothetical protein F4781DRAFT_159584 [Annulohypoxylon bovei var. microspora]